ncbi:hypothetical protein COCSUDRAFT_59410 [Coccomyxa subellipsoidea C-169]|uniref:Cilia- and flagella-associated protein 91 n=1 Tax=Coccomyxa subellipsoidea (strain C-169) TaxID=574566 RepID=I0Z8D7_COCSC|nr:hypothetical protein COCSUDRAFT_59410 [Coccomyxa subellipsoidea C-169]EIE26906.1 hypothetical protein COCSUDRAFT_59410 [Coccomyxa subellipsoidea C-169]|eukprot:XP_005651450.1 hypothetical protein COCSUDRAFT_59410 [Coccomyxa subellipsoidea C-169]
MLIDKAQQQSNGLDSNGFRVNEKLHSDRSKTKQDFESTLPPLSDSKNLLLRKDMLEAWEKAEWSQREAQIQALQEEQLQAFQAEMVAQDGRAEQRISQRLLSRQRSSGSGARNGRAQWSAQALSKGQSGGSSGSKGQTLTPLEDFVQSNMPLQGRSLFKRPSLDLKSMEPAAQLNKTQTAAEGLLHGSSARRGGSPDNIAAYRPRESRTTVRKDMAYAQHLETVHRALMEEKAAAARQEAGIRDHPLTDVATPADSQPPSCAELPAATVDFGSAQVLVLDSRGSTAEGWLTAPESARDPIMDASELAGDTHADGLGEIQIPQMPGMAEDQPQGRGTPDLSLSTREAPAEEEFAVEEAMLEEAAEAADEIGGIQGISEDISSILEDLVEHAEGSEELQGTAGEAHDETAPEAEVPGAGQWDSALEAAQPAAAREGSAYAAGQSELLLSQEEENIKFGSGDAAVMGPSVEEAEADLLAPNGADGEGASLAIAATDVDALVLAPSEGEDARPATAVSATVESIGEEAARNEPGEQEGDKGDNADKDSRIKEVLMEIEGDAPTLDMLISLRHSKSILAAAGMEGLLLTDITDVSPVRPGTAVSQTVDELVVAVEADFIATTIFAAPETDIQNTVDQISPAAAVREEDLAIQSPRADTSADIAAVEGSQEIQASAALHDDSATLLHAPETPIKERDDIISSKEGHFAHHWEESDVRMGRAGSEGEASLLMQTDAGPKLSAIGSEASANADEAEEAAIAKLDNMLFGAAWNGASEEEQSINACVAECVDGLVNYAAAHY